jgi:hypothetical protein
MFAVEWPEGLKRMIELSKGIFRYEVAAAAAAAAAARSQ